MTPAAEEGSCTAVVIESPRHVELRRVPITPAAHLGAHEVLVRSRLSLLSPGTELAHYRGSLLPATGADRTPGFPFRPGYATLGTVLAAGPESGFSTGASVLAHSPHQDLAVVDTRTCLCVPVPTGVDDRAVPFARLAQVGAVSLAVASSPPGTGLGIVGLGLVGNLAGQLAAGLGYHVIGVDPSASRRRFATDCGLDCVASTEDLPDGEDAPSTILECSGRPAAVLASVSSIARRGEVFLVGAPWSGGDDIVSAPLLATLFQRFAALRSGWEWQLPTLDPGHGAIGTSPRRVGGPAEDRPGSIEACTLDVLQRMAAGEIRTEPLVTDVVRPDEVAGAYRALDADPDHHLGVLVDWSEPPDRARLDTPPSQGL